ncbi:uncharacterized protein LOC129779751 [Toxorhynchites rutilus septentrionalis]|uniref:uncharacterized protein LOC129779751 n=1 Tax=Toxorhynchites rutilus septentrionalis TaxID=329112 RepID=UPI00247AAB4A|nr:uncharacterized protein LOC129779751 [Toxorhynchites rutilus septentrionalis]XP_055643386.1 uncharacterized protein LOC129779751 [Toxorhynchites rutilus septentrionalis]
MRPSTLNLQHKENHHVSRNFLREAYTAWSERAENCVVLEQNVQKLFYDFGLLPTTTQVNDMLRTSRLILRGCTSCNRQFKRKNGLTFGEFSVLITDIRKIRHTCMLNRCEAIELMRPCHTGSSSTVYPTNRTFAENHAWLRETTAGPEVFLGGSCNPTTWRADVAIPTLERLGISFYNPQVSEWTPDLLDLEHRAKEKAKVLFFVMDSQTRSTAGAIEVAHIAGRNSKHLVLVLLPYEKQQTILNDVLTIHEYTDLSRNQLLLSQLVRRRGLPVLNDIPLALEYIKYILSGGSYRGYPQNIAARLISVRRTYDRVAENSTNAVNLTQCQTALVALGYPSEITSMSILRQILFLFGEICRQKKKHKNTDDTVPVIMNAVTQNGTTPNDEEILVTFDGFCILDSYLSVLHQDIVETNCVSPIKGTNVQQPPIYLSNSPECNYRISAYSSVGPSKEYTIQQSASSSKCNTNYNSYSIMDSRQTDASFVKKQHHDSANIAFHNHAENNTDHKHSGTLSTVNCSTRTMQNINLHVNENSGDHPNGECRTLEIRDLYLGGSCWMLTNWRQKYAVPYLKSKNITFYTSTLHEGLEGTLPNLEGADFENYDEFTFDPTAIDASRILLFVITNETRSLGAMTMAAHYIGMGYNVVMCVQMLVDGCTIRGTKLSDSALKDYNRGRAYLVDLAKRHGIPVFNDINTALKCALEKIRL